MIADKREQVARWYDREAARPDGGAFARMSTDWATKIRAGKADHRLEEMLAGQAEYKRARAQSSRIGSAKPEQGEG